MRVIEGDLEIEIDLEIDRNALFLSTNKSYT